MRNRVVLFCYIGNIKVIILILFVKGKKSHLYKSSDKQSICPDGAGFHHLKNKAAEYQQRVLINRKKAPDIIPGLFAVLGFRLAKHPERLPHCWTGANFHIGGVVLRSLEFYWPQDGRGARCGLPVDGSQSLHC